MYGVLERQFRRFYSEAKRQQGNTGSNLLVLLERRLDNAVFAAGFRQHAARLARQMVVHGHVCLNGRKATRPSMLVSAGDSITIRDNREVQDSREGRDRGLAQPALAALVGCRSTTLRSPPRFDTLPARDDVPIEVNELFVVEACSR